MSQQIRIDDLADPRYTDAQRAVLAWGEEQPVDLRVDAVLDEAVARAGLDDLGPDDFRERLALWLEEADDDPDRTGLGRLMHFNDCVRHAVNRLRIRDLLTRHPEIHDVPIERPIIVVGPPRSGTTHLVNLIAADRRLRSLPFWECGEPVPDPAEAGNGTGSGTGSGSGSGTDGVDPRRRRAQQAHELIQVHLPHFAALHPTHPDHVHEEQLLQLPDFSGNAPEWASRCPRWGDYYRSHDQTPHYAYMRTVLQALQWLRPGERWVLKSPQHLEQLGPLLATFPDATLVLTHRDPVSIVQSVATMMTYAARMTHRHTRPDLHLAYCAKRIRRLLDASLRDRHLVPAGRSVDVPFHELEEDDPAVVERIYEVAGLPLTAEARAQILAYHDAHPRGKDGRVAYDLRADFDVTPDEVRAPFGAYLDRFPVHVEVT